MALTGLGKLPFFLRLSSFEGKFRLVFALWLSLSAGLSPAIASVVLKVNPKGSYAAISHDVGGDKWALDDRVCAVRGEEEIACGVVIKVGPRGAIVKIDKGDFNRIRIGDDVEDFDVDEEGAEEQGGVNKDEELPPVPTPAPQKPKLEKQKSEIKKTPIEEKPVDLGSTEEVAPQMHGPHQATGVTKPRFKILFDWLLTYRPGLTSSAPLTFDTYHNLLMVDFFPTKSFYFGFELSQNPRFYELDLVLTKNLLFRLGRIYIPFDDLSPHSFFGGRANVAKLAPVGGTQFLPDLWTDLGIGLKYQLFDLKNFRTELHLYVVNGFGDGASDPAGSNPSYPKFDSIGTQDNNDDKAVGGRIAFNLLEDHISFGVSGYRGRFSSQSTPAGVLWMYGTDGQIHLGDTEIRGGFVFMHIDLATESFVRAGYYGEISQKMGVWKVVGRFGQIDNDSRLQTVNDLLIAGAALLYKPGPVQLSLEYSRDIQQFDQKTNYDYAGFRVAMSF